MKSRNESANGHWSFIRISYRRTSCWPGIRTNGRWKSGAGGTERSGSAGAGQSGHADFDDLRAGTEREENRSETGTARSACASGRVGGAGLLYCGDVGGNWKQGKGAGILEAGGPASFELVDLFAVRSAV